MLSVVIKLLFELVNLKFNMKVYVFNSSFKNQQLILFGLQSMRFIMDPDELVLAYQKNHINITYMSGASSV